ncbi:MAG: hypothetical protein HS115_13755 [Spirochaetales bacterium]|nr:hypothetical protein [Spirochaetales bacterium]
MVAVAQELELHFRAYSKLFTAVLQKKNAPAETRNQVLLRLQDYLKKNIHSTDDFINHIGRFAQMLAVPESALATFIGANFLSALSAARKEVQSAKETQPVRTSSAQAPAAPSSARPRVFNSVIDEMLHKFGGLVQPPDHFTELELGMLKFVSDDGDLLPASLGGPAAPPTGPGATVTGKAPAVAVAAAAGKPAVAPAARPAFLRPPEKPLIDEILEKFGNVLDIPEKLEVPDFAPEPPAAGAPQVSVAAVPGAAASPPPPPRPVSRKKEEQLIDELLNKFGNVLDIHGALHPADGLGSPARMGDQGQGESMDSYEAPLYEDSAAFEPIPCSFQEFMAVMRLLQEFRAKGNQEGYRLWLTEKAGTAGKAIVGLRNMEGRLAAEQFSAEYQSLATRLGTEGAAIEDLHQRTRVYARMQKEVNDLTQKVKQLEPAAVSEVRKIWPQILLLFNEPGTADGYESQMKMILLQVGSAPLRERIVELLRPTFSAMQSLYERLF